MTFITNVHFLLLSMPFDVPRVNVLVLRSLTSHPDFISIPTASEPFPSFELWHSRNANCKKRLCCYSKCKHAWSHGERKNFAAHYQICVRSRLSYEFMLTPFIFLLPLSDVRQSTPFLRFRRFTVSNEYVEWLRQQRVMLLKKRTWLRLWYHRNFLSDLIELMLLCGTLF